MLPMLALLAALVSPAVLADVLDAPATLSPRAGGLVQLAVAQAGDRRVSAGERGTILLSDDQGKSWRQVRVPVSVALTRLVFVDKDKGWAVGHGGVVLHTQDSGESWVKQLDGIAAARLELAQAESGSGGAAERRLAEAERLVADGADKPFLDVRFFDALHGMVVGAYGLAFETADGGQTWKSMVGRLGAANGRHLYAIHATRNALYLFGEQGLVLASGDAGATFAKIDFPGKGTLFGAVSNPAGNALLAHGLKGNAYRSADAGKTWQRVDMPPVSLTVGIRLASGDFLLADESGQLHRSADEGKTFKRLPVVGQAPLASLLEAADGSLVGSGVRGTSRITLGNSKEEKQQ